MTEQPSAPQQDPTDQTEQTEQVAALIGKARFATVTTVGPDGALVSRPLAVLDRPFDGDLYFFTADPSGKTEQVRADDRVNVALNAGDDYLSLAGTASVTRDPALIDELWSVHAEAWFTEGRDDPAVALLAVHAESAELWSTDGLRVVAAVKYAKALLTHTQPEVGESTKIEL